MKKLKICLVILCLLPVLAVGMPQFDGANFFMKEIIIKSKKHGVKIVLVDDEDFDLVYKSKWSISGTYPRLYAKMTRPPQMLMHRLIMNPDNDELIDHADMDGLNNRKNNLRICTKSQNMMNRGLQNNNTSGFKGVYFRRDTEKFAVEIKLNGKKIRLGCYKNLIDAAKVYNEAAIKHHGEFAKLNTLPCVA